MRSTIKDKSRRQLKELTINSKLSHAALAKTEGGSFMKVLNKVGKTAESYASQAAKQAAKTVVQ